jgi:hypothetical protein
VSDEEWLKWVNHHSTLFAMRGDDDLRQLHAYRKVIEAAGWTYMELCDASEWLALHAPPHFRCDHLSVLRERIVETRALPIGGDPELIADPLGTCTTCGGSGRVIVPHPRGVADGYWLPLKAARAAAAYYTAAVLCHCPLGQHIGKQMDAAIADAILDKKRRVPLRMMDLADYERINPDWRKHMEMQWNQHVAEAALQGPLSHDLQTVLDRLAKQVPAAG